MSAAYGAEPVSFITVDTQDLPSGQVLTSDLQYLEDVGGSLSLADALQKPWQAMPSASPSFGYTHSVFWFRMKISHTKHSHITRLLEISYPVLDRITVYHRINGQAWQQASYGDKQAFAQRPIQHRNFVFPVGFEPESLHEFVFRVETSSSMQFPITLWKFQDFFEQDQTQILGMGLYYGIMLVMVLYNLFIFFSTREINYLYYVCYAACMALFLASLQGLSFQYLWPNAVQWNDNSIVFFLGSAILFGILFTRNFLQIQHIFYVNFILSLLAGFILIVFTFSSVLNYHIMIQTIIVIAIISLNLAIGAGIVRWVQGYTTARYYTIAWFTILFGGIVLALNKFNIIPRNFFTENIVQIGSALEVILLSFALAERLNQEKRKRYQAQDLALLNERRALEAQRQAYEIQAQANETLERRVKERTLELEEANKQLEFMSITDALTGIRNRRYFDKTMQLEMARAIREQEPISVLIVDIDYFKHVNDGYGHQVGDEVLKAVACTLKQLVHRSTDLLARFGGEEFVLILPNTTSAGASHVAECIRTAVAELKLDHIAEHLSLTVSVGVFGDMPTSSSNYEKWVSHADDALYYAKNNGRNRVIVYSDLEQLSLNLSN